MRIPTLFVLAATAALLPAQKTPEVEPNDTPVQAMPITAGMHLVASYATTLDEDWYSFTLTSPGQVHLHTVATGTLSLGTSRDNRIAIYDASGATRLAWNDGAVGNMADCGVTLPAGSYVARVGLKTGTAGTYDLDFYVLPPHTIDTVEAAEPNGASDAPTPFTPGQTLLGELLAATPADEDYWSFVLSNRGIVVAATYDDGGVPQADNMALRFHTGAPGAWTALGTGDATNSAGHRITTLAHPGVLAAGNYAIAVKGGTVAVGTAPWDYAKVGQYALRTALIDMPGNVVATEAVEPNNIATTPAGLLGIGDDATGFAAGSTDEDWYMLPIGGPTLFGAMAEGALPMPLGGSSLTLYDDAGNVVASASGSATTHARLVTTIERPGIFFLAIRGPNLATQGDYLLRTGQTAPLYVSNSTRVEPASTNACVGTNGLRPLLGYMSGETPAFGSTFVTRLERALPNVYAVAILGISNTLAFGTTPLPWFIDWGGLDGQGNPSPCYARVDPAVTVLMATDAGGTSEYSYSFGWTPTALGIKIYQQIICQDPFLNATGVSVTNDSSYVIGDRPF